MTAAYRCLGCGRAWEAAPGPVSCPSCGHQYVAWLNYAETFGAGKARDRARPVKYLST